MAALLATTALVAAACGADTVTDAAEEVVDGATDAAEEVVGDDDADADDDADTDADDDAEESLGGAPVALNFSGLEPLGDGFVYEGWIIVDGSPVSTGRFTIDEIDGERTYTAESTATQTDLDTATDFVLSIEPAEGDDPAPADAKPLGGAIVDGVAELSIAHPAALGNDFSTAAGQYVITAPTTTDESDDTAGVWFIEITDDGPAAGLDLPELPAGWVYEGWAVIDGQALSTGRFLTPEGADDFSGFSGSDADGPPFPGEDFVANAPDGLEFPADLSGSTIVISIEPEDDDSPAPFAFKPLASEVPAGVEAGYAGQLGAGPGFPTGIAAIGPDAEAAVADFGADESLGGAPIGLEFSGLEPLGEGFVYEGWILVDGSPVSTGRFTIDEIDGERTYTAESTATQTDLDTATDFVLSIEPAEGDDPAPADAKPLGGAIVDGVAELSIAHPAALGNDFSTAAGQYVITAPTTTDESDDTAGVWFIEITDDGPAAGLDLPELPAGWVYEGWAVIDGQALSTGRFLTPEGADDFSGFSGSDADGPPFPGEDFVANAPDGLEFPADLSGSTIVISIEPEDDDSPAPFAFKPLAAELPAGLTPGYAGDLGAGPGFPTGTATIG